jgi:LAO/AO transport system kinase
MQMPGELAMPQTHETLLRRFRERERRALAEILTLAEMGQAPPLPDVPHAANSTLVVGITGSGGAGKSTLVSALIQHLRSRGKKVAVLACDPQSPRTGGALLGDRIRAKLDPADEGVYFRSLSTRGAAGGISSGVGPAIEWLKRFGFDVILVETVGIGQDQVAVRNVVDALVLLVTPHTGDEVQWEKAGVIEVADLVAVNKSDLPGAARVRQQLEQALALDDLGDNVPSNSRRRVQVINVIASTGDGVAELWNAIESLAASIPP